MLEPLVQPCRIDPRQRRQRYATTCPSPSGTPVEQMRQPGSLAGRALKQTPPTIAFVNPYPSGRREVPLDCASGKGLTEPTVLVAIPLTLASSSFIACSRAVPTVLTSCTNGSYPKIKAICRRVVGGPLFKARSSSANAESKCPMAPVA